MPSIMTLSLPSEISLYVLLALLGLFVILVFAWQIAVLRGKAMDNPDGTVDDWHEQKILYGMAVADLVLACPITVAGVTLVLIGSSWGHYALILTSFWFVWANTTTTVTSLRFERPRITASWLVVYPLGALIGLGYIAWSIAHMGFIIGG